MAEESQEVQTISVSGLLRSKIEQSREKFQNEMKKRVRGGKPDWWKCYRTQLAGVKGLFDLALMVDQSGLTEDEIKNGRENLSQIMEDLDKVARSPKLPTTYLYVNPEEIRKKILTRRYRKKLLPPPQDPESWLARLNILAPGKIPFNQAA